uniref:DUF659 domain-containing protein n=1 Tax=Panagrellus redivivus TaxID=6233 RepID=A0A7E4W9Y5_PANRE
MANEIDPPNWNDQDEPRPKMPKKEPLQTNMALTSAILINDGVYSESITLRRAWKKLIDIPAFQSLKKKRYLGFCSDVYSGAKASVFDHCLGTYHVASKMLHYLKTKQKWLISDVDEYCIEIAALFANAGRAPFIKVFQKLWGADYHPQKMAVQIFEHAYSDPKFQEVLDCLLSPIDVRFVKELIDPLKIKWGEGNKWLMHGRPKEKAFLYDIVVNNDSGLDACFLDYILRSCKTANYGISFDSNTLGRIIQSVLVVTDGHGPKIVYSASVLRNIQDMFQGAVRLDAEVVRHKKVIAFEIELDRALNLSESYEIRGKTGRVSLRRIYEDVEAFIRLDDGIISNIINADETKTEELNEAIKILEALGWRRAMGCISRVPIKPATREITVFEDSIKQHLDPLYHNRFKLYELQCDGNINGSAVIGVYFKNNSIRFYDCSVPENKSWLVYVDTSLSDIVISKIYSAVNNFAVGNCNVVSSVLPLYKVDPMYK